MKVTLQRNLIWLALVLVVVLGVALATAQALAGGEGPPEYVEDVVLTFGLVTLAWSTVHMGVINILKGISIKGEQLLNSRERIWLANAVLGIVGLTIAYVQDGSTLLAAFVQAALAVLAGVGVFEAGQVGKKESSPAGG